MKKLFRVDDFGAGCFGLIAAVVIPMAVVVLLITSAYAGQIQYPADASRQAIAQDQRARAHMMSDTRWCALIDTRTGRCTAESVLDAGGGDGGGSGGGSGGAGGGDGGGAGGGGSGGGSGGGGGGSGGGGGGGGGSGGGGAGGCK